MDGAAAAGPLVGLFGAFDTGDLGEVALRRVIERELRRRRPDIEVVALAPFGVERPIPGDDGRPARPLPSIDSGGLGVDALIVTGDVLASDSEWAKRYGVAPEALAARGVGTLATTGTRGGGAAAGQVIWFGVGGSVGVDVDVSGLAGRDVWVRDPATQQRVGGTAVQSGDPVLLAARVLDSDTLRRRADLLRLCGVQPPGRRLVLEVTREAALPGLRDRLTEAAGAALRADPALSLIVLSLNPTAPLTAGIALSGPLAERVHHLPAWVGIDDIAAAMSGAVGVIATTATGGHLAAALGTAALEAGTETGSDVTQQLGALLASATPDGIVGAVTTLDGAFAELAERLPRGSTSAAASVGVDSSDSAIAILQQRLVDERTALQAELSRLQAEIEHLQGSPEHRIARPIREGYQRWQRRRT